MKTNIKLITVSAVTFALTVVLGWLPYVFFVPLLFTCVTRNWKMALAESLFFGVLSLVYSYINPASFVAMAFIKNPWMPIVPRVLAGMGCHGVYVLLRRVFAGKDGRAATVVPVTVACAVGAVLNTALVVPCFVWRGGTLFGNFELTAALLVGQTLVSGAIELAVAVVAVPPLAVTVGRALRLPGYMPKTKPIASAASDSTCQEGK